MIRTIEQPEGGGSAAKAARLTVDERMDRWSNSDKRLHVNWVLLVIGGLLAGWLLPKRLIPSQLAALRPDPRLVASAAAILWLLIDDRPGQPYATFADPGAAVMLSIIFGDALALAVQRRWDRIGKGFFFAALFLKLVGQSFFYISRYDTQVLDITFLFLTHALMAIAATGAPRPAAAPQHGRVRSLEVNAALAFVRGFLGLLAVGITLAILNPFLDCQDCNQAVSEYYTLAAARALIPYLFWTTMLTYSSILYRSTERSDLGKEPPIDTWLWKALSAAWTLIRAQKAADFGKGGRYRRWMFYLALALPAILLTRSVPHGLNSLHFPLGWPFPGAQLRIGGAGDWSKIYFDGALFMIPYVILWTGFFGLAWKARSWARARPDWSGAFVQGVLISLYCALVICFFSGVTQVIWNYHMCQMDHPGIERGALFALLWLPNLYAVGAAAILVTLFLDARLRPRLQRTVHVAFAAAFVFAFYHLPAIIYPLSYQGLVEELDDLKWTIKYARQEQVEPSSERPRNDAKRLDQLEKAFAEDPQLDDAFRRLSRRVAAERGPRIIHVIMERSRNWSDNEGLIFLPLLSSLPRTETLRILHRYYDKPREESDRLWAGEFLRELGPADAK